MTERMERIRIPDDDVNGWMKTLHEGGFSSEEIDSILENLNEEYFETKNKPVIDEYVRKRLERLERTIGKKLSLEDVKWLREKAKAHIRNKKSE
jgi:hypothetical protein